VVLEQLQQLLLLQLLPPLLPAVHLPAVHLPAVHRSLEVLLEQLVAVTKAVSPGDGAVVAPRQLRPAQRLSPRQPQLRQQTMPACQCQLCCCLLLPAACCCLLLLLLLLNRQCMQSQVPCRW
jgi:hypothetical protein